MGKEVGDDAEGMTGAEGTINVDSAVNDLAESLKLVETPEEGAQPPEGQTPEGEPKPKDEGAPPPAAKPAEGKPAADAAKPAETPAPTAEERVPDTWRKEAKEAWASVAPVVRQEIAKRENDIARFVAEAQPSFQIAQTAQKVLEPYLPLLTKYGVDPIQHVANLLNSHTTLLFGEPAVKAQMFRQLAQQAGVDLAKLADPNSTAEANSQSLAYIRSLEERVARMEQGVTGVTSQIQEGRVAELEQGIMAFAQDTENHPFFWELAQTGEIKALIDTGAARTLKDAYELAVYRNPVTRSKQIAREADVAAQAQAKKNAEKAANSRRASEVNVRSRGSGKTAQLPESLDDTLKSTLQDIRSRTH